MNPYEAPQTRPEPTSTPPLWVTVALAGVPTRTLAWWFCWLCLLLALASVIAGFWDRSLFWGVGFVLAALWYYLAIRWTDQHQRWTPAGRKLGF